MKKIIIILSIFLLSACTDEETAQRVLEENGFTDIKLTGHKSWCCAKDDHMSTGFTAKTLSGKTVSGCVCNSWGKGATIRFE